MNYVRGFNLVDSAGGKILLSILMLLSAASFESSLILTLISLHTYIIFLAVSQLLSGFLMALVTSYAKASQLHHSLDALLPLYALH